MKQDGLRFTKDFTTLIIAKGGYTPSLRAAARESDGRIVLVDVADMLAGGPGVPDRTADRLMPCTCWPNLDVVARVIGAALMCA